MPARHILALLWLCALMTALGLGGAVPVACLVAGYGPAVKAWRWLVVRRFRRRLREVAAAHRLRWVEPKVVGERMLEWPEMVVPVAGQVMKFVPSLEVRKISDLQILEFLKPIGGAL